MSKLLWHIGQIMAFGEGCLHLTPLYVVNPWTADCGIGLKKLEMHNTLQYTELFTHESPVWQTDRIATAIA